MSPLHLTWGRKRIRLSKPFIVDRTIYSKVSPPRKVVFLNSSGFLSNTESPCLLLNPNVHYPVHISPSVVSVLRLIQSTPLHTIPRQLLTSEAGAQFQASPYEVWSGVSVTVSSFSPTVSVFPSQCHSILAPYSVLPYQYHSTNAWYSFFFLHHCSTLTFIHMLVLSEGQTGEDYERSKRYALNENRVALDGKVLALF